LTLQKCKAENSRLSAHYLLAPGRDEFNDHSFPWDSNNPYVYEDRRTGDPATGMKRWSGQDKDRFGFGGANAAAVR